MVKLFEIRDLIGRPCGYLTEEQLSGLGYEYAREGGSLRLSEYPAPSSRMELLNKSLRNALSADQRSEVRRELALVTSSRITSTASVSTVHPIYDSDSRLYVTRDHAGFYLGLHSLAAARDKWQKAYLSDGVITVDTTIKHRPALGILVPDEGELQHYSDRVRMSLDVAIAFTASLCTLKQIGNYWATRKDYTYAIYADADTPVCCVPYLVAKATFGNKWVVISEDEIQIISTWSREEMESHVKAAVSMATSTYTKLAPRGQKSIHPDRTGREGQREAPRSVEKTESRPGADSVEQVLTDSPKEALGTKLARVVMERSMCLVHLRELSDMVDRLVNRGFRAGLLDLLNRSFPEGKVVLPSGMSLNPHKLIALMRVGEISDADLAFLLPKLDDSLTEAAEEEARAANEREEREADRMAHDHAVTRWAEAVLADDGASRAAKVLATEVVRRNGCTVLVMSDDDMYHMILSTEMSDETYEGALAYAPFPYFVVHTPNMPGHYGFGVLAYEDSLNATIVPIPDDYAHAGDAAELMPSFKRILFVLCAERENIGVRPTYRPKALAPRDVPSDSAVSSTRHAGHGDRGTDQETVAKGQAFVSGIRVVYVSESKAFRPGNESSRDIKPHAVAGTKYTNRNGREVCRRPYWNHGAGSKRNTEVTQLVERRVQIT